MNRRMMNQETLNRLREAKRYEIMAIKALFPEKTSKHIDIIEKEVKAIMREFVIDIIKNYDFEMSEEEDKCKDKNKDNKTSNKNVKKVKIV